MKRFLRASAIALLACLTFVPVASARGRVFVGGGFGYYGPGFYGPAWGGWYGPYGGYPYGYYPVHNSGDIKIETHVKGNSIFVDGGYAGITGKLKKFPLRPGTHTIELRDPNGRTFYQQRVEVIRGRTLEINPDYRR